jgi:hypothetical protein
MRKKINILVLVVLSLIVFSSYFFAGPVQAAPAQCFNFDGSQPRECQNIGSTLEDDKCYTEQRSGPNGVLSGYTETSCRDATDRDQDGISGGASGTGVNFDADCEDPEINAENCGIISYIVVFTKVLSGLVGIVVVIMIAVGGIQYTMARDDPQAVNAAKTRIRNAIFALVFYLLSVAFLQYIVPGGIF